MTYGGFGQLLYRCGDLLELQTWKSVCLCDGIYVTYLRNIPFEVNLDVTCRKIAAGGLALAELRIGGRR